MGQEDRQSNVRSDSRPHGQLDTSGNEPFEQDCGGEGEADWGATQPKRDSERWGELGGGAEEELQHP